MQQEFDWKNIKITGVSDETIFRKMIEAGVHWFKNNPDECEYWFRFGLGNSLNKKLQDHLKSIVNMSFDIDLARMAIFHAFFIYRLGWRNYVYVIKNGWIDCK